jgi:hypothetical protein
MHNGEKVRASQLRSRGKDVHSWHSVQQCMRGSVQGTHTIKRNKRHPDWKRSDTILSDNMISYVHIVKNPLKHY